MSALVSVVIPTFNAAPYLRQALDSVLAQASRELELDVIVVDDGSSDSTPAIVGSYRDRVRYFRIPHCGRPGVVRNYGLQQIRGECVAFLDDDDFWLPGSLARRLAILQTQPSVGFVYGNFYLLEGDRFTLNFTDQQAPSGWIFDELFERNFIHTSTVLARRRLVDESGGFHPYVRGPEDYWLWLQFARRSPAAFVSDPVSVYRLRSDSLSANPIVAKLPDLIRVVCSIGKEFRVPSSVAHQRINPLRLWLAKEHLRYGRYWHSMRWLFPALLTQPKAVWRASLRSLRKGYVPGREHEGG